MNVSALYQTRKDRMIKSLINTIGKYFWSVWSQIYLKVGLLFDITNAMINAINILIIIRVPSSSLLSFLFIIWLQNNNSVTSLKSKTSFQISTKAQFKWCNFWSSKNLNLISQISSKCHILSFIFSGIIFGKTTQQLFMNVQIVNLP